MQLSFTCCMTYHNVVSVATIFILCVIWFYINTSCVTLPVLAPKILLTSPLYMAGAQPYCLNMKILAAAPGELRPDVNNTTDIGLNRRSYP